MSSFPDVWFDAESTTADNVTSISSGVSGMSVKSILSATDFIRQEHGLEHEHEHEHEHQLQERRPISLAPPVSASTLPPLLQLPPEIHELIFSHLSWRSIVALRQVHKIFANTLISPARLPALHTHFMNEAHRSELCHPENDLGFIPGFVPDFSYGIGLPETTSLSAILPCYRCLRWLPSADAELKTTAFSRTMATGTKNLARPSAKTRVCIECGIRSGFHPKGTRVAHRAVCWACGALGEWICRTSTDRTRAQDFEDGLLSGWPLRWHYFCRQCVESGEIPQSMREFEHERLWAKYEKSLARGRQYRAEKGRRIRAERGIVEGGETKVGEDEREGQVDSGHDSNNLENQKAKQVLPKKQDRRHFCPIMKEKRHCDCWKVGNDKLPLWAEPQRLRPWKW